jgi:hypothetical protein
VAGWMGDVSMVQKILARRSSPERCLRGVLMLEVNRSNEAEWRLAERVR